jgi:hypothetical protein
MDNLTTFKPQRRRGHRASVVSVSLWFISIALFASVAHARINVVTLPARDSVQLTIYNSADLTLVRETRYLTFRKGLNKLEFSWANTLIDPTSVEFRPLTHADQVEVLDVSFPPRVTNTLEWRINSEVAGEVQVEIRYFTSGISWSADYVAEASRNEKQMDLAGAVRVNNNSGEDYENAEIRLVVGVIKLVEDIAQLARQGRPANEPPMPMTMAFDRLQLKDEKAHAYGGMYMAGAEAEARPRQIIKEGVSEYFLYTVEGRDTIPNGWSKRLPSFKTADVPVASYYKFESEQWGDQVVRFYRFKNSKEDKLGNEPLPDGDVKAFRFVTDDKLYSFVGRTNVKYIPIGEEVEMNLGNDQEIMCKPTLMNWEKTDIRFDNNGAVAGWTIKETWQIEAQNSKDIDVTLDIRRNFSGDWSLDTDAKYEKVDASKVKFVIPLKSREQQKLAYEITTRYGTNATR